MLCQHDAPEGGLSPKKVPVPPGNCGGAVMELGTSSSRVLLPSCSSSPESCPRGGWGRRQRNPAANSAGPITAPSFGDVCKQNKEDGRLMHRVPDSHELGGDTSLPLGRVADPIHCSFLTCHRADLEQSGLETRGSSQLSAATRLQICQLTKDPNYTQSPSPIHC